MGVGGCRVVRAGNVLFQFALEIYPTHVARVGLLYSHRIPLSKKKESINKRSVPSNGAGVVIMTHLYIILPNKKRHIWFSLVNEFLTFDKHK